jgi:hypothetical protein
MTYLIGALAAFGAFVLIRGIIRSLREPGFPHWFRQIR